AMLYATGVWHQYPGLSVALLACLVMLPLYAAQLIHKLSEAKRQAEEANHAKSMFLACVSHEVRTPLNAIIGLGDLLQDQLRDPECRQMVSTIADSGRSLLRLINSILDFSRIEAGRMPSQAVVTDLYVAIERLKAMLAVQTMSKQLTFGVHITACTPSYILADYSHIEQILMNLAANAIKFTEKGFVVVTVDAIQEQGDCFRLRFEVSDTGIGIPADAQSRIFESFVQADATIIDRYGGTGLGLAISKQLVQLLNGQIGFESSVGEGSTFWFEVDVVAIPTDDRQCEFVDAAAVLFSLDEELRTRLENAGVSVIRTARLEEVEAAIFASHSAFGHQPVLFVDHRESGDMLGEGSNTLDELHELTSAIVLVTDSRGVSSLPLRARSMCATSLARSADENSLRHALRLAKLARTGLRAERTLAESFAPAARALSVLVAEDNCTNQMVIVKTLERIGHSATVVDDGEAALDALERNHFDVILMDVNMPVMNGIEATKLYRMSRVGESQVPVVALTADATADAWDRCREAGMNGYVTKPIEPARLIRAIESALSHSEPIPTRKEGGTSGPKGSLRKIENSLDLDALADLEDLGGRTFVSDLVSQFSSDATELLSSLRAAVAEEDVQRFREIVHALRGSAANLGIVKIFETCGALRAITPSQMALEGDEQVSRLVRDVDQAINILKEHLTAQRNNVLMFRRAHPSRQ
ncbi:MAG TPA: ATP-binding protein, partial [Methylocella sp.]|nr:ATP-binding protein [Methylocella sp.]